MTKFLRAFAFQMCILTAVSGQQVSFDILKGNAQEILTSYFDRDSNVLFTYDRAGMIVMWDVNNMAPLKRYSAIPANIWRADATHELKHTTIAANQKSVWITSQTAGMYAVKNGSFSVYDRSTGSNVTLSDTTSGMAFTHLLNNGIAIVVYSPREATYQNGKLFSGSIELRKGNNTIKKFSVPFPVTAIKVSKDEKLVALGFKRGGVDVLDVATFDRKFSSKPSTPGDEVLHIDFLNENKGIVYTYGFTGSEQVYLHRIGETQPSSIVMDKDQRSLKISIAESGKYLAIFNPYKLGIYDLEKGDFVARNLTDSITIKPNAVTFLTDDIILLAGVAFADTEDVYSVGSYEKAGLLKMDWKRRKVSANFSFDDLNRTFMDAQLTLINDSTFKVNGRNGKVYQHIVGPNKLKNTFSAIGSSQQYVGSLIENDSPSTVTWYLNWSSADYDQLYSSTEESADDTVFVAKVRKIKDHRPIKIHSDKAMVLWLADQVGDEKKMLIADFKGKILYEFQVNHLYENSIKFSSNGQFLAYQPNATAYVIVNTKDFSKPKTIQSGLSPTQYVTDQLRFNHLSTQAAFRVFNQSNQFLYLAMDVQTGRVDTLCKLGIAPYSYALSADFKQIALSLPLRFSDTSLFNNRQKMQEAARYGFKNVYDPNVLVLNLKEDRTIASFSTKNKLMAAQLLVTPTSVIALQEDGLFYHYRLSDPEKPIAQWLAGKEQVLLGNQYYFSSTGAVNRLSLKAKGVQYPVGQQDRFFNQPHRIMEDLGSKKQDLINLYKEAFQKRIKQYQIKQPTKLIENLAQIRISSAIQQQFEVQDSLLHVSIDLAKVANSEVRQLFVKVNDYSIYGKNGLTVKSGQQQLTLNLPLDLGKNDILIQGIDANGSYLNPVRLNYKANFKPSTAKRKLFLLAAGVSKYADSSYNLKYAAKDAADFARLFARKNNFDSVIVKTLANQEVNLKNFIEQVKSAKTFGKGDVVMVFLAGHGVLDDQANFYYATHDMDFQNPQKNGLAYETILDALEELPSRSKMLLIDACHSGLLDRSHIDTKPIHQTNTGKVVLQDQRGVKVLNTGKGTHKEEDVFLFMQKVFNNMTLDNHVNILSASLGNSYALENDSLQNGLFTYCLIKGIGLAKADPVVKSRKFGESSFISLPNLEKYLTNEVRQLSNGKQTPTFSMSRSANWIYFSEPEIATYTYDFDYKPLDNTNYKPSDDTLYKQFLERYKKKP